MATESETPAMSQGRGLLTESERKALAGNASDSYQYKTRSYFRDRLDKLADDVGVLKEHDPELLEELRDVVCEDTASEVREQVQPSASEEPAVEFRDESEESAEPQQDTPSVERAQSPRAKAQEMLEEKGLSAPQKEAVLAAWDHLRERGMSQRSTFIDDVYPDHHAGYADRGLKNPERAWWKNVIDDYLPDLPNVEKPPKEGGHQWTYTGENA